MSDKNPTNDDQARFWNEDGGRRWVEHIDQLERMLNELNGTLLAALALRPGEKVLDVGCGGGRTTLACREAVGEAGSVLGVDVSAVILDVARARGAGLGLRSNPSMPAQRTIPPIAPPSSPEVIVFIVLILVAGMKPTCTNGEKGAACMFMPMSG